MYLNAHSCYSLRHGILNEKELLELAQSKGITAMALTDINNTSACLNFIRIAPNHGIKPIVGIDFRNRRRQLYVGLAVNNIGFQNLNQFLSKYVHSEKELPQSPPTMEGTAIIYPFEEVLKQNKIAFNDNEYIGVSVQELRKIKYTQQYNLKDRWILLQPLTFRNKRDFNTHRLLRAIDNNTLLSKLSISEQADPEEKLIDSHILNSLLTEYSFIKDNTQLLIDSCNIFFDFSQEKQSQNLRTYTGSIEGDKELLIKLCNKGLPYRYPDPSPQIYQRIEKEMDLIQKMNYVSFFLINWDIVEYARSKNYFYVGRGSGANSIIAYLLNITNVDPIELDLYFERFMNLYRSTPPDFDIDFSWRDREDVTRYIFERFGQNGHAALIATYSTFKHSAAIRELGKVFGLPKHEIDILSDGKFDFSKLDNLSQLVVRYSEQIKGMPNLLSVHAAGILISEKPIYYFTATNLPPKGFPTTQFDMVVAEDVGLYKFDILGQRGLGKIKDTIGIIKANQPDAPDFDIHDVKAFIKDPRVNEHISTAQCIGCFYVESPAMRMLLRKLEVDNYLGLVAASSIIRPGVAKSGMMREFILRHKDPERRKSAHPVMWSLMEDTYGVMVYQEDVIKVAHHFAGLDLGEADVLRRGMSGKYRSREEFQKVEDKFYSNCKEKGYSDELTREVWTQIESFAGYAFAKGHSASYAVESYQSLYLKTYYPLEYMVATLNNGGGFYRAETYIHEARMHGGVIHAPCINQSLYETTIKGQDIYLGFQHLAGLDTKTVSAILNDRHKSGKYTSLDELLHRVPMGIEQADILIRVNALRTTGSDKRSLLWRAHYLLNHDPLRRDALLLFHSAAKEFSLPAFTISELENSFDQIELLGFSLADPFSLLKNPPSNNLLSKDLSKYRGKIVVIYGNLVTVKYTNTSNGQRMYFGTFLDQEGEWIDTVHFPPVASKYPFRGRGIYALRGKVVDEFGFLSLEIDSMSRMEYVEDPRYSMNDA